MGKKPTSALHDLFVSIRRVLVLMVAAFGLAMGWPLEAVAMRSVLLWGTLVILSHAAELLFQYLSHRAMLQQAVEAGMESSGGADRS